MSITRTIEEIKAIDFSDECYAPEAVEKLVDECVRKWPGSAPLLQRGLLESFSLSSEAEQLPLLYAVAMVGWKCERLESQTHQRLLQIALSSEYGVHTRDLALWACTYPGQAYTVEELKDLRDSVDAILSDAEAPEWSAATVSSVGQLREACIERLKRAI